MIVHCHAGVHRAPLCFALMQMYMTGRPLAGCLLDMMERRYIAAYSCINEGHYSWPRREDRMLYIVGWERDALRRECSYRLPEITPVVKPEVPPLNLPLADTGLTKLEPNVSGTAAGLTAAAASSSAAGSTAPARGTPHAIGALQRSPWNDSSFQGKVGRRWMPKGQQPLPGQKVIKRKEEPS